MIIISLIINQYNSVLVNIYHSFISKIACIRHKSITERVLKRRNSEHALQQAMNVARSRQETLARLINEHQKLVKEVEKWSSLANVTAPVGNSVPDGLPNNEKEQSLPLLNISLNETESTLDSASSMQNDSTKE